MLEHRTAAEGNGEQIFPPCARAPGENIFKTRRIPFSRENPPLPSSAWFCTAVLGQEIPKIIYNNAARFDSPRYVTRAPRNGLAARRFRFDTDIVL